ncbi:glycoside hydrolase family 19 protein [Novosphingobium sp. Leaf2]|uniref:glycoside hydrolase family 19 protein n=1 Tax=Novosphingobium sp. Leaf2 TaxID=1735670 RepID=UPI000702215E|nr:glycoside hydrolase family 19 protein [Novosphingobium sp. Leaf2]KQM18373.1 glycoside hydrolase [Novosphingobium sp. Leaf2]
MIDTRKLQTTLGVKADGQFGPLSFAALFRKMGASTDRAEGLAYTAVKHFAEYGIMDNALRLAHFLAQVSHESGGFRYMEEIWGPTAAQKGYEGRADLGNTQPGDGLRYKGRGPLQLTGRANYRDYGKRLGLDLEGNPALAATPAVGLLIALEYWRSRNLNALADKDDVVGITKRINGGTNGLNDRKARLAQIKGWML